MKKKILIGIGLMLLGILLGVLSVTTVFTGTVEEVVFIAILGIVGLVGGSIFVVWGVYQGIYEWQRKKAVEVIAEGVRKAQEEKQKEKK